MVDDSTLQRTWNYYKLAYAPDLPDPQREYRFDKKRRWRLDVAYVDQRVFVELQGGTWVRGGHSRGRGQTRDCEKHNALVLAGWRGLYLTTDMLTDDPELHFKQLRALLLNLKPVDIPKAKRRKKAA